jgi:hypothetical protein
VPGPPPILAEDQMGPLSKSISRAGLVAWKGSGSAGLVVQLRDQKRADPATLGVHDAMTLFLAPA